MKKVIFLILTFIGTNSWAQPYQFIIAGESAIYTVMSDGSGYEFLHLFGSVEGPTGPIYLVDNRILGVTTLGGDNNRGFFYEYDLDRRKFSELFQFNREFGSPGNSFILKDDIIYGSCIDCIFRVNLATNSISPIYEFEEDEGFIVSYFSIIDDIIYGAPYLGGTLGSGTFYTLKTDGSDFNLIHTFGTSSFGRRPTSIAAIDDKIYITTAEGSENLAGTLLTFDLQTSSLTKIDTFSSANTNLGHGRMVKLSDGCIYGTTNHDGIYGYGTIFKFSPNGIITKLFDFSRDYGLPRGDLFEAPNGEIYGLTWSPWNNGNDVVYKINKDGTGFEVIFEPPSFGASSSNTRIIMLDPPLGPLSSKKPANNFFQVHPNPYTNLLNVIFTNANNNLNNLIWQLLDTSGKQYEVSTIASDEYRVSIDISKINSGVYFLRTIIDGQLVVKRFIKS